ncbi:restriction endonuclease subunit S [uncultured Microbacterium sp.]|uniref:restriction endonuclease subunit S n=1 Tax=Microbacterium algeriense TaxID=2615184 RepID=UPI0025966C5F|nr:restriction endonuclease subunit S [uncultured Microbacterium sp.]
MQAWSRVPLTDVLDFREGPGILAVDFKDAGVPLIRLSGLKRGGDLLDGCNYLDPEKVDAKWSRFRLRQDDVLLSTSASLGEVAVVGESGVGAIPYTGLIAFRAKDERVLSGFIPLMLREHSFKAQIEAMGVGSVMRHFGPSHLRSMFVTLPPVDVQRGIAEVLGALDDKIAANNALVSAADHLMHQTFISTPMSDAVPLSSTADFVNGKAFTKDASGTGRVVVRIAELNGGISGSTVFSDASVDDKHVARPGDILFAWSGSLTLRRWFRDDAIVNQHIFKVIPRHGFPAWLSYALVGQKLEIFKGIAADKATTMGHIQRHHLDEVVQMPSTETVAQLDPLMSGLWSTALNAEQESLSLAAARDVLLPQLMSGKLKVRDVEAVASAAGV